MIPVSLSDDETTIYYKVKGMGFPVACRLDKIIVDKID